MIFNTLIILAIAAVGGARESQVRRDVYATECVNELNCGTKVDADIIIDVDAEKIFYCINSHIDAVETGVSEFVFEAGGAVELDVVIAWDAGE